MEEKKTNYDKTREDAEQRFLAYDQEKMIRKFSLKADENYLYLRFVEETIESAERTEGSSGTGKRSGKIILSRPRQGLRKLWLSWMCSAQLEGRLPAGRNL